MRGKCARQIVRGNVCGNCARQVCAEMCGNCAWRVCAANCARKCAEIVRQVCAANCARKCVRKLCMESVCGKCIYIFFRCRDLPRTFAAHDFRAQFRAHLPRQSQRTFAAHNFRAHLPRTISAHICRAHFPHTLAAQKTPAKPQRSSTKTTNLLILQHDLLVCHEVLQIAQM